ncbi:hypothetical protein ACA910_018735 [Epithemia clementina (nom. ined.)]
MSSSQSLVPPGGAVPMNKEEEEAMMIMTNSKKLTGYSVALLRTLQVAGVKYIRYQVLDAMNQPRIKCIPVSYLWQQQQQQQQQQKQQSSSNATTTTTTTTAILETHTVAFARVVMAGLPSFGDYMQSDSGLDARGTVVVDPDWSTLRILPYAPTAAVVFGSLRDGLLDVTTPGPVSDLCCRSLLQRIVHDAATQHGIGFNVGVELEFTLYQAKTNQPVDGTNFAHSHVLNQQQDFFSDLHQQLVQQQDIAVELLHAESGPGQVELVLSYCSDPILLCDRLCLTRDTLQAVAHQHGLKVLFLPKIDAMKAGSGCHLHLSLYDTKTGEPMFPTRTSAATPTPTATELETGISLTGQAFLEGILAHLPALVALSVPTTNSFRRIGPGCWTGSSVNWSYDDKESPLRVVGHLGGSSSLPRRSTTANHVEYKLCDHTANLYLALAGILSCGVQGICEGRTLRPHRYAETTTTTTTTTEDRLPETILQGLDWLEQDEWLQKTIPKALMQGYLALRRAEAERGANMTLEEEVQEALRVVS